MSQDFYNIPNLKADAIREQRGMRVHAWRGIGAGYNKFVSESFLDEVAAAKGMDPLAIRLELTKDKPRAQAVIKAVAEMSNYKKKRPGRGMGIAFSDYHDTLTAGVAEVSVVGRPDPEWGEIVVAFVVARPALRSTRARWMRCASSTSRASSGRRSTVSSTRCRRTTTARC